MFGLFKSKPQKEIQKSKPLFATETHNLLSEKFLFTFKRDTDKETFVRNTQLNIKNRLLPIDIEPEQIIAYTRHKGTDIGLYKTDKNGFGFYILKKIQIKSFVSFVRKDNPNNQEFNFQKEIISLMEIEMVNPDDNKYMEKFLDMYVQKYLLLLIPQMNLKDKLLFNRNGLSIEINKELTNKEVNLIMAFLYQIIDNFKNNE